MFRRKQKPLTEEDVERIVKRIIEKHQATRDFYKRCDKVRTWLMDNGWKNPSIYTSFYMLPCGCSIRWDNTYEYFRGYEGVVCVKHQKQTELSGFPEAITVNF